MFEKHKFLMIYRIEGNQVIVDGMFHELQDYDGILQGNFIWVKDVTVSYVSGSVQQTFGEKETSSFYKTRSRP